MIDKNPNNIDNNFTEAELRRSALDFTSVRLQVYRLLAALFQDAPSVDMLQQLVQVAQAQMENAVDTASPEAKFYAYMAGLDMKDPEATRRDIASEYGELFVGPRPPLAPLYESIYIGFPNRLFTDQTLKVRSAYERNGLTVVKSRKVPDDHIGYEFEFMAEMVARQIEALNDDNEANIKALEAEQRKFLADHLALWTGKFAARIHENYGEGFYSALAVFADDFVMNDLEYLMETR